MAFRMLLMGLPGSGKTTLAQHLLEEFAARQIRVEWLNSDAVREAYDDWDFTIQGRLRQSERMKHLADASEDTLVIADFVAPLRQMREQFDPHCLVWLNTISEGRFEDTNTLFEPPSPEEQLALGPYFITVPDKDAARWAPYIAEKFIILLLGEFFL